MAGEITDVTVRFKLDTKQVEQQEAKTKQAFDVTNKAIETQTKLSARQARELEKLIKLQEVFSRGGRSPEGLKIINKQIEAIKRSGTAIKNTTQETKKATQATKKLSQQTKKINKTSSNFVKTLSKVGVALGIAFSVRAVIKFTKQLNQTAIQMEAFRRRAEIVFGDSVEFIKDFAKQNAIALGFTENEFLGAAAAIGDLIIPMVANREEAAKMSTELLKTAAALKIFQGSEKSVQEISDILTKSLAGRVIGLRQLQINIDRTSDEFKDLVKVKIEDDGVTKSQAKSLAIYDMILKQSNEALVSFDENTDSLARSQSELQANVRSLNEELAILVTPLLKAVTGALLENVESVNEAETGFGKFFRTLVRTVGIQAPMILLIDALTKSTDESAEAINNMIGALFLLTDTTQESKEQIKNLFFINEAIKELREEQNAQRTSLERLVEIRKELIPLQERRKELLGQETEAMREQRKALEDLAKANKKFRDQVFKDIEKASKRIEDLQIENIESEFVRDIRKIEKSRERELAAIADTLATEEQKRTLIEEINENFDQQAIDRNQQNADMINEITEEANQRAIDDARARQDAINGFLEQGLDIFSQLQQRQTNIRLEQLQLQGLSDEEFETKRREILRESAQNQKSLALFEIAVATAKAVTQALSVPPAPNIPLATLAGILGAAQLAVVATTPIPIITKTSQFAEGTLDAPGGLSMVGERGRELTILPSGTKVLPNDKTEKYSGVIDSMFRNKFDQYIMERYIPDMLMTESDNEIYNDHRLRGDVRNSRFNARDADRIGRSVAKHTSSRAYLMNRYA